MADESDNLEVRRSLAFKVENETAWLLARAIAEMSSPKGEARRWINAWLRKDAERAAALARRWIGAAQSDPMLRWSLVYVIADIEDERCLETLADQALRRLPPPHREPGICEHPGEMEELVAIMAIEGIGRLARKGHALALELLLRVLREQDRRSLRRPTAAEILATRPDWRERVREMLPQEDRHVVDLRDATITDITIEVTEDELRSNPNLRQARPKLPLRKPDTPAMPCGKGR